MKKKIFCFDLDGVICKTLKKGQKNYKKAIPIIKSINTVNSIYNEGYRVIVFTSRYMGRNNDKANLAIKEGYKQTEKQLQKWGLKYNKLIFGKPSYDVIVDDKSLFFKKNWHKKIMKIKNK